MGVALRIAGCTAASFVAVIALIFVAIDYEMFNADSIIGF